MLVGQTPTMLVEDATAQLASRVQSFFNVLLTQEHLRLGERVLFSGRAMLAPGVDLTLQQLGMPEAMAWGLFEPLVVRELHGDAAAAAQRNKTAAEALDAVMARSWVILNRAPTFEPTALLAFHPVRTQSDALRVHPLVCKWLNADFDGDQAAVFLPLTLSAQQEAGERLSVAAHLTRDASLLPSLVPVLDVLWGLASLSQKDDGLAEISELLGMPVETSSGFVTHVTLSQTLSAILARDGAHAVLDVVERLMHRGFAAAKASGASISPFLETDLHLPVQPQHQNVDAWHLYRESVSEAIAASSDYHQVAFSPQLLMVKASGRGLDQLLRLISGWGAVQDATHQDVIVRHGYAEGLTPEEMFAAVAGARRGIANLVSEWARMGATFRERNISQSFHVFPRALRAQHPGLVFARAAEGGEVDPLTDVESRLLVGLPITR